MDTPIEIPYERVCTQCHISKPLSKFGNHIRGKYGKSPQCRSCRSTQRKEKYRIWQNSEHVKQAGNKICTKCQKNKDFDEFRDTYEGKDDKRGECRECEKQQSHTWHKTHPKWHITYYAANAEKLRRKSNEWYYAHQEYILASRFARLIYFRAYRIKNLDRLRRQKMTYRHAHPDIMSAARQRRRARKAQVLINDLSPEQIREIKQAKGYRCVYCDKKFSENDLTVDHLSPLGPDGPNTLHNVLPACLSCNAKKKRGPVLKPVQPLLLTSARPRPMSEAL